MSVIRVEKNKNYTTMSNYHLRDKNLSLKAKGLLSLMLSLPEDWDYSVIGLEKICVETSGTINGIIQELEKNNYMQRKRIYENGKIKDWEYTIYEEPNLDVKNQHIEKQHIENLYVENCTQLNTNIINNNTNNNTSNKKENKKETEIFNYWNSKKIIEHKELTDTILKEIQKALKTYKVEEIKLYIDRYAQVYNDIDYFFNYKWTLIQFLRQKNAMTDFKDDGGKWNNYQKQVKKPEKPYRKPKVDYGTLFDLKIKDVGE